MSAERGCVAVDRLAVRTYEEVGAAFGISGQRVQQIEREALRKLRLRLREILIEENEEGVAWLDRIEREARARDRAASDRRRELHAASVPVKVSDEWDGAAWLDRIDRKARNADRSYGAC